MKKHLILLSLIAAMLLPGLAQGQTPCTITVGPGNPYIEGFEGVTGTAYSTAGVLPACWTAYYNGTTAGYLPHVTSGGSSYSYYHSGSQSLVMTSGSGTDYGNTKHVVLPEFSLPLNQLQISFWMCTESNTNGVLSVGYLTNATDTSSFVTIQNFPACAATYHSGNGLQAADKGAIYDVVLNNVPATAQRLAFRWSFNSTYYSCCIDDVTVEVIPNCSKPTSLTASNITATTIDLAWTSVNTSSNGYRLFYYPTNNASAIDSVDLYTSDTSYQLTLLQPNTAYTIQIATICSDYSLSSARTTSVRTSCVPISRSQMPYVYGFEDASASGSAGTISPCWNKGTNSATAYPYPSSSYKKSGSYSLYFYSTNGTYYSYAVMPPVEDSVQDLQVTFNIYRTSTTAGYGDMQVGVMTDPADYTTFTQVGTTFNPSATSTWEEFTVSLASYTGTGLYVAFRKPATAAGITYLDDVTLEQVPACPRVENLTASNITAYTADLSWQETGTATSWTIEYGPAGFTLGTGSYEYATDTTVTLTGLTANTQYEAYVTVDCGTELGGTNLISFRTSCVPLTSDDLPYTENFESYTSGAANPISPCWRKGTNGTTNYPYPYTTAGINSGMGLYFYGYYPSSATSTRVYSYAALPPVDESLSVTDLQLAFDAKRYSTTTSYYHSMIIVGVMSDPSDIATFDTIQIVDLTSEAASSIHHFDVPLTSYDGTGSYIAFYSPVPSLTGSNTYAYNHIYIDNVELTLVPMCLRPANFVASNITSSSADISWSEMGSGDSWVIEYDTADFVPGNSLGIVEYATDTTALLTGLQANTTYYVYIHSQCSGDTSLNLFGTFRTACSEITSDDLPYIENFESYTSGAANPISPCWRKGTNGTTNYPYPYSTAGINSGMGLYFYGYYPSTATSTRIYSYAALPAVDESLEISDLQLAFDAKRYSTATAYYQSYIVVGVMSNPNDISTFDTVQVVDLTNEAASSIHHITVALDSYTGNGSYVALYSPVPVPTSTYAYNYIYIDNVVLNNIPSCRASYGLTASNVTPTSADLTWNNTSVDPVSDYTVAVSTNSGFNPDTCTSVYTAYDTNLSLTGLSTYTRYYWAVRTNCGSDSSEWSLKSSFFTPLDCGVDGINILDTIGNGTTATSSVAFYPSTTYPFATDFIIFTAEELAEMGLYSNNRINSISLHTGATGGTLNNISVYMAETATDVFGAIGDTMHTNQMQQLFSGNMTFAANSWNEIVFDSAFVYSGTGNLMLQLRRDVVAPAAVTFYYTSTSPNYRTCYRYKTSATATTISVTRSYSRVNMAFNVCTTIPACERPDSVAMLNLQPTQAQFGWQGTASQYEVAYGPAGFDPDGTAGTHQMLTADSITLTGLTSQTNYDFYVRAHCSNGDTSDWTFVQHFFTPCMPMSLPYTEDFESYASGSTNSISSCWVKGTTSTTAYPYPYSTNAITGSRSLYFYAYHPSTATAASYYSYAALPLMNAAIDSLQVSFNMRRYQTTTASYTSRILVGLMTDPSDISTFTAIDTIDLKDEPALSVHGFEVSFAGHANLGNFIAFYDEVPPYYGSAAATYSYLYLDDILVDYIPTCPRPINVTVADSTITGVSAEVSWTDRANPALGYEIEYGPAGHPFGQGTRISSNNNPITLTGLQPGSQYEVYVRAICSATDSGDWSFAKSFYTACESIDRLPVTYDFESYATGTSAEFPHCWTRVHDNGGTYAYYPYINTSTTYAHSGTKYLYFYGYNSTSYPNYQTAVLPEIDTNYYPANTLEVTFWGRGSSSTGSSYYSQVIVGMISDPTNYNSFVPVDTVDMGTSMAEYSVDFSNYQGHGSYVAFRAMKPTTTSTYNYCYIDDITIAQLSPCGRPDSLVVLGADATSAQIDWVDTVGATTWVIEYGLNTYGAATQRVVTTSHPYTFTGLQPMTGYWFNVASICPTTLDTGGFARQQVEFTTTQLPAAVPYYCNFEDSTESANWQFNSNNNVTWYRGALGACEGTHGLYISADNGATRSTNMSTIVNAVAYRDIQFDTIPAGYTVTFKVNVGGTQAHNYDGLGVLLVDPSIPVEASSTGLTSPWGHVNQINLGTSRRTNGWVEASVSLDSVVGVQRLAFYWFNQATGADDFVGAPAAIDSVVVEPQPCQRPYDVYADNITSTTALIHWQCDDPQANYTVTWRVQGTSYTTNLFATTTGTSYTLTGLTPNTAYYVWVSKDCDSNSSSDWSINGAFATTMCDNQMAVSTGAQTSTSYNAPVNNFYKFTLSETIIDSAELNGPQSIGAVSYYYDYGTAATSKTNVKIYLMPTTKSAFSSTSDIVEVDSTAVLVYTGALNCTQGWNTFTFDTMYAYDGLTNLMVIVDDSSNAYNGSGYVFGVSGCSAYKTITYYSDSYHPEIGSLSSFSGSKSYYQWRPTMQLIGCAEPACGLPANLTATNLTYQSATVAWTGAGTSYEVSIKSASEADYSTPVAVNGYSYTFTGLQPATTYVYRVRQDCNADSLGYSDWVISSFTTDSLPCFAPANFHVESVTGTTATFGWTAADASHNAWDIRIFNTTMDSVVTVTTNPVTISNLVAGVTYYAQIRTLCGDAHNIEGDYSDSIVFNPANCPNVTNLTASNVTFNSVTLAWTADSLAQSFEVAYIMGGSAVAVDTLEFNTNTCTISGLYDQTAYIFNVRAICGADWQSGWAEITATTLEAPANTVTITAASNNNSWGIVTGGGTYEEGDTVTLTAIPATNCEFIEWDDHVTTNPRTVIANSNMSFIATFAQIPTYTITVTSEDETMGTVTGGGEFLRGTEITIEATANEGFQFMNWSDGNGDNPRTIIVTENATYTAHFDTVGSVVNYYTVTLTVNDPAMGTVTGAGTYVENSQITISAAANAGYHFVKWSDENTDATRTITVTEDVTLEATFAQDEQGIDDVNATLTCTIYPNPAHSTANISVNGVNGQVRIAVLDMSGRVIANDNVNVNDNYVLNVEGLAAGTYFVRVTSEQASMVKKLIVR